jgi:hypothetical protein
VWRLASQEVELLRELTLQVDAALDGPTDDPVVARLFPRAAEDDSADEELRALLSGELLFVRHERHAAFLALLERAERGRRGTWSVLLVDTEPELVLAVLNDIRLALGARIGLDVVEDRTGDLPEGVAAALDTMDWLAAHQSLLLEQLA